MASAFFNKYADLTKARAISAGTHPAERVHPEVIEAMREAGIDLSAAQPQKLIPELAQNANLLITMGCGDECPYVPDLEIQDWALPDPKGQPIERVRAVRDQIRQNVTSSIDARDWR